MRLMSMFFSFILFFFLSACEASVLPRAKICVMESDFEKISSDISQLMEDFAFDFIVDSSKHENISDVPPAFIHWKRADGINLSLDDYTDEGFSLVNVYEEKSAFSEDAARFYRLFADKLVSVYGADSIKLLLTPEEARQGKGGLSCND